MDESKSAKPGKSFAELETGNVEDTAADAVLVAEAGLTGAVDEEVAGGTVGFEIGQADAEQTNDNHGSTSATLLATREALPNGQASDALAESPVAGTSYEETRHRGVDICVYVNKVDRGEFHDETIFVTGNHAEISDVDFLKQMNTVSDIDAFTTAMTGWLAKNRVKAWKSGICNTLLVTRCQSRALTLKGQITLDSIVSSMVRKSILPSSCDTTRPSGYLRHMWGTPYQLTRSPPGVYMTDDAISNPGREEIYVKSRL